jgi:hypothetical protein
MPVGWNPADTDFDTVGETGGSKTKALTTANLPSFTINLPRSEADNGENDGLRVLANNTQSAGSFAVTYDGSGVAVNIMNPYRIVMFIEPIPA